MSYEYVSGLGSNGFLSKPQRVPAASSDSSASSSSGTRTAAPHPGASGVVQSTVAAPRRPLPLTLQSLLTKAPSSRPGRTETVKELEDQAATAAKAVARASAVQTSARKTPTRAVPATGVKTPPLVKPARPTSSTSAPSSKTSTRKAPGVGKVAFVDGYESGVRVEVPDVIVQNPATADISIELQLDKDGEVEYERVYVGPEDSKIMVGQLCRAINHPLGWKAYTKFGIDPRYGRRQELLQWLVGRHLRRYGA